MEGADKKYYSSTPVEVVVFWKMFSKVRKSSSILRRFIKAKECEPY